VAEDGADNAGRVIERVTIVKHITTLSGATIAGALAVYGALFKGVDFSWPFYVSLGAIAFTMLLSGASVGFGTQQVDRDAALHGDFWRDQKLDELVEETSKETRATTLVVTPVLLVVWYLGFFGLILTIALRLQAS